MKIQIARIGEHIAVSKDYRDIESLGEVTHIMAEIDLIKQELLEIWKEKK